MEQKSIDAFFQKKQSETKKRQKRSTEKKESGDKKDLAHLEGVLKMYREIGHLEGVVDTLIDMAILHAGNHSFLKAMNAAERAYESAQELEDIRECTALLLLGDLRYLTEERDTAVDFWNQVPGNSEVENEQLQGAFLRLAQHEMQGKGREFRSWIERSEALEETTEAALLQGLKLKVQGNLMDAEEWIHKALSRRGKASPPTVFDNIPVLPESSEGELFRIVGEIREEGGKLREASEAYQQAGDFLAQGDILQKLGNMELALSAYETGGKRTSNPEYIIKQAEVIMQMGHEDRALTLLVRNEKELAKKDLHLHIAGMDLRLSLHRKRGDLLKQSELLEKKGAVFEKLSEYEGMTNSLLSAATILQNMDDEKSWKRAVGVLEKIIESEAKRRKYKQELLHRTKLEELHLSRGKPIKKIYQENVEYCYSLKRPMLAVGFFQKEMELHKGKEEEFLDYLHLARSYLSGGKRVEALAAYREAEKHYPDPKTKAKILREMGYLYRVTGDMNNALKSLNKAITTFKRVKDREGQVKALAELEKLYDDEIAREKMVRSKLISQMNTIKSKMEKLTDENNGCQKIIRETTKLVEERQGEAQKMRSLLEQMRLDAPRDGTDRKKQLSTMDKLRTKITKIEESNDHLQLTIRENQSNKLRAQEEKTDLKQELLEIKKQDAVMKKKIEKIEATGTEYRKKAMKMDPMLATSAKLETIEEDIYHFLASGTIPQIRIPTRTKDNIEFSDALRVFRYGSGLSFRSAKSTDGANMLMRTAYVIDFIDNMIRTSLKGKNRSSTLRELYYISESWGKLAKFGSQNESNNLIEDLEIITRYLRENFHLRPEEDGARVIGNITLREKNRKGEWKNINCREDVGDSGYTIPYNAEKEKLTFKKVDADFVVAIETGGMFDRLVENGFDEDARAVLVHIKGQPARSTRRFLKRINEETRLPILVFTDGDPWSYRIFASIAYGAIKTAHISHHLATPSAEYVGITPSDIITYDLPTDKLNDRDVDALNSELTDPRFADSFWQGEISTQLKIRKKSEQQALAKYGLDFVTDTYLPEKLGEMGYMS